MNPHDEQKKNLSLIFEFDEEISEIIGNEKDETKLIFEKYLGVTFGHDFTQKKGKN